MRDVHAIPELHFSAQLVGAAKSLSMELEQIARQTEQKNVKINLRVAGLLTLCDRRIGAKSALKPIIHSAPDQKRLEGLLQRLSSLQPDWAA